MYPANGRFVTGSREQKPPNAKVASLQREATSVAVTYNR